MSKLTFPMFLAVVFIGWGFSHPTQEAKLTSTLTVRFENLEPAGGTIRLALYDRQDHFMMEEKAVLYSFKISRAGTLEAELPGLSYGTYAFAVFQDENENRKLDKNLFGVPVEAYCFSKTASSKWRLPKFGEVKFEVNQPRQTLTMRLEKWKL